MKKRKERQTEPVLVLSKRLPDNKRILFLLWQLLLLLVGSGLLTYFTLRLSYSSLNPDIWLGYWEDLWIPAINFAIIFSFCLVFFALIGRAWIAYLLTALIWLGAAIGNYYLIIIRSDPLQFQDITCLREALAITGTQSLCEAHLYMWQGMVKTLVNAQWSVWEEDSPKGKMRIKIARKIDKFM